MADLRLRRRRDIGRAVEELADRDLNFDLVPAERVTSEAGWRIDDYCQALPSEPPGPPVNGGSWEIACKLARNYDFADPSIVTAFYDVEGPLEERNMLLELRFRGLRAYVGVRVGDVYDDTRELDGRQARVWGWNYRTLAGHLEAGQMDWQIWKWLDNGEVQFRIHAFSRPARGSSLVALGFRLVGRREQLRFLRHTCRRMAELTEADLAATPAPSPAPAAEKAPTQQAAQTR